MTQSAWLRQTSDHFAGESEKGGGAASGAVDDAAPTEATARAWVFTSAARGGVTGARGLATWADASGDFAYAAAVRPANGGGGQQGGPLDASASPLTGFSMNLATGQNASGVIQTTGDLADAHWTVSNADNYKQAPIAFTVDPTDKDWFSGGGGNPGWLANGPNSSWIAADPDVSDQGFVTYTITFDLTGYNPADATLMGGEFTIDDQGIVLLNGHQIGSDNQEGGWSSLHALSNGAGDFVAGVNTIVIETTAGIVQTNGARFEGTVVDTVTSNPPGPVHWASDVSGDFSTATDWTTGFVPSSDNDAILDAPGGTPYTVTASSSQQVESIQTAANATLDITAGVFQALTGTGSGANAGAIDIGAGASLSVSGSVDNSGVIALNGAGGVGGFLTIAANATLSGGGQVTLTDSATNRIGAGASAATLTNVDNIIAGSGTIGSGALTLVNQAAGTIEATGAVGLTLTTGANTIANAGLIEALGAGGLSIYGAVANTGALRALGSGALTLNGATVTNTGGTISAATGALILLHSETITGGAVSIAAGATLAAVGGVSSVAAAKFTNSGTVSIDAATLDLGGSIANHGVIILEGPAGATLAISANTTLGGGGALTLTDVAGNRIVGGAAAVTLTNLNNVIDGSGTIGSANLSLVNGAAGTIDAGGAAALVLTAATTNAGLIEATGIAGLTLEGMTLDDSAGGILLAGDGSRVVLTGATIVGGALETVGSGLIRTHALPSVLDGTASSVTNFGTFRVSHGADLTLEGAIDNTGRIQVRGRGEATTLVIGAAGVTLSGGGFVTTDDTALNAIVGASASATLTNVDNTIMGAGALGGGTMILVNEAAGTIDGDSAAGLTIDTGANAIVNAGLIEATRGGALTVESAIDNTGTLFVAGGGVLTLDGDVTGAGTARIHGGTLDAAGAFSEDVAFAGGIGELGLAQSQSYTGTVSGFSRKGGTSIDLGDIAFVGPHEATWSGGVLTVTDGTHTALINLTGNFARLKLVASDDGHGGTLVTAVVRGAQAPDAQAPAAQAPAAQAHRFTAAMASLAHPAAAAVSAGASPHGPDHLLLASPRLRYA